MKVEIDREELIAIIAAIRPKESVTDKIRNLRTFHARDAETSEEELEVLRNIYQFLKEIGEIP